MLKILMLSACKGREGWLIITSLFGEMLTKTKINGDPGSLATIARELGQIRKKAAAASDLCAGM